MSLDLIKAIIQEGIESNGKSWKYIEAILSACEKEKVFTINQFKERQEKFKKYKTSENAIIKEYRNYEQRDSDSIDFSKFIANIPQKNKK